MQVFSPTTEVIDSSPWGNDKFTSAEQTIPLNGYFLVPFAPPLSTNTAGQTVGDGFGNQENRTHSHSLSSSIDLSSHKYALDSGSSRNLTHDGSYAFSGTTDASSNNVPYVQLLLCEKCDSYTNPLPAALAKVIAFHNDLDCPSGWKATSGNYGRYQVGLPSGGSNGATFPSSVSPLSAMAVAEHKHPFSGQVTLPSSGVTGDNGCDEFSPCSKHYGSQGTYSFSGTSGGPSHNLPYMAVTSCQPD